VQTNNKPDTIIRDNEKGTCMLIGIALPWSRNVIKKEVDKILKCKGLITEIQRMWNVKTRALPVITGNVLKSFRKNLSNVPAKHEIKELQKRPHWTLNTHCGQYWCKIENIFNKQRINIACSTKCKYTAAATVYILETCFVWGM
jgi:hypothetical protein